MCHFDFEFRAMAAKDEKKIMWQTENYAGVVPVCESYIQVDRASCCACAATITF
jgi:hypothetical protein